LLGIHRNVLVGYKLHAYISKALKAHSKAIQQALIAYNQAVTILDPPHPKLTWAQIVEYTTLVEFELLRTGAHEDICNMEWADAWNRQTTICHLKISQANEEIIQLNIETKQLETWVTHESLELNQAIATCAVVDPVLSQAVTVFAVQCRCVNAKLQVTLGHIHLLQGYSGETAIGMQQNENDVEIGFESSDEDSTNNVLDQVFEGIARLSMDD